MKLKDASWLARRGMTRLLNALGGNEGQTRFVGGCVRDALLGIVANDVDLATRLEPGEVLNRLQKCRIKAVPTGIEHGTITALLRDGSVEVTTLRRDVSTDGRRATVAFSDDWKEDASRRDFTINALYTDPQTLEVIDYFGGIEDLQERKVRFIGDPLVRIAEDHLRILRFFRFHAKFGAGTPDPAALNACGLRANDLMALSRERIADELLKLLDLPDPSPTLTIMIENGILKPVLPEIDEQGLARLKRLVQRERAAETKSDALRRLAALIPQDKEIAAYVGARLRLSRKATARLASAVDHNANDPSDPLVLAYRIGGEEAVDRILLGSADPLLAKSLTGWHRPRLPISGGDLIEMGLPPGPIVGKTLREIETLWADAGFDSNQNRLRALAREKIDQLLRASQ